ncbi:TRAP transporter small permease [Puniceibacterium sp. IMCC21224]|uniref:TRAP transporter small permease n=1 Tax=Puniceibacterium sp. IMCC21224 TaxID=1618204 RepID=UPI00064DEABD|nr:TRAP transporter small permease subunit [Puniceibacterium sp. IMCC21224]KMK68982.1 TRAP-type C4-dicarboxylate transport system, small permease component [Puniceibacterium sp. IMCC21224]
MASVRSIVLGASRALDRVASVVTCTAIVLLTVVVLLQVVARYVFHQPPAWTEELARYAMIWAGLIGATMAFKRRFDPALVNGVKNAPTWVQVGAEAIRSLVVLIYLVPVFLFCFVGPGMNVARGFLLRHSHTMAEALPFSTVWVAIAVPIMIVVIFVHLSARWAGDDTGVEPIEAPD